MRDLVNQPSCLQCGDARGHEKQDRDHGNSKERQLAPNRLQCAMPPGWFDSAHGVTKIAMRQGPKIPVYKRPLSWF